MQKLVRGDGLEFRQANKTSSQLAVYSDDTAVVFPGERRGERRGLVESVARWKFRLVQLSTPSSLTLRRGRLTRYPGMTLLLKHIRDRYRVLNSSMLKQMARVLMSYLSKKHTDLWFRGLGRVRLAERWNRKWKFVERNWKVAGRYARERIYR